MEEEAGGTGGAPRWAHPSFDTADESEAHDRRCPDHRLDTAPEAGASPDGQGEAEALCRPVLQGGGYPFGVRINDREGHQTAQVLLSEIGKDLPRSSEQMDGSWEEEAQEASGETPSEAWRIWPFPGRQLPSLHAGGSAVSDLRHRQQTEVLLLLMLQPALQQKCQGFLQTAPAGLSSADQIGANRQRR